MFTHNQRLVFVGDAYEEKHHINTDLIIKSNGSNMNIYLTNYPKTVNEIVQLF